MDGDILYIRDTGAAYGHSIGFNYNGKPRPKELLLHEDGGVELIRREATLDDRFATLTFVFVLTGPSQRGGAGGEAVYPLLSMVHFLRSVAPTSRL